MANVTKEQLRIHINTSDIGRGQIGLDNQIDSYHKELETSDFDSIDAVISLRNAVESIKQIIDNSTEDNDNNKNAKARISDILDLIRQRLRNLEDRAHLHRILSNARRPRSPSRRGGKRTKRSKSGRNTRRRKLSKKNP